MDFWKAMVAVADHELEEAAFQEEVDQARVRGLPPPPHPRGGRGGVHKAVEQDVHVMLSGKTLAEVMLCCRECGITTVPAMCWAEAHHVALAAV